MIFLEVNVNVNDKVKVEIRRAVPCMYKIRELAEEFQVTTRTIRYYEELNLLTPKRSSGNQRIYTKRDHVRLRLILRGKRYGFTLEEIKEMIGLFEEDSTGTKQLSRTILYGEKKIEEIECRMNELEQLKSEMIDMLTDLKARLCQKGLSQK
ncbi:MerR family transcriptional regulator [Alkalihalophilus marmarensis]|uniref:MerR family transcriptional regulator n=1 Tax=Alkalihalophilus marmarensis TaxID=521377 RepID=UPI002DBE0AFE|nr:MerR family DNA-binding transcriptional regulator [Alkalihalophilus marmarensis]MEC2070916.1 MerR family DNA-binding transcriptional regulator [Alkalihalophilus marmarensis]